MITQFNTSVSVTDMIFYIADQLQIQTHCCVIMHVREFHSRSRKNEEAAETIALPRLLVNPGKKLGQKTSDRAGGDCHISCAK